MQIHQIKDRENSPYKSENAKPKLKLKVWVFFSFLTQSRRSTERRLKNSKKRKVAMEEGVREEKRRMYFRHSPFSIVFLVVAWYSEVISSQRFNVME